jgi:hypothetical protein
VWFRQENYFQNRQNRTSRIAYRKKPMLSYNLNCAPILYNSGFFFPSLTLRSQQGGDHKFYYDKWTVDYFYDFVQEGSFSAVFYSEEQEQTDVLLFSSFWLIFILKFCTNFHPKSIISRYVIIMGI